MLKLLLMLLGVWIVLVLLKQRRRPPAAETRTGTMVSCAVCGIHLPDSEAITSGGKHYCGEAHFLQRDQT